VELVPDRLVAVRLVESPGHLVDSRRLRPQHRVGTGPLAGASLRRQQQLLLAAQPPSEVDPQTRSLRVNAEIRVGEDAAAVVGDPRLDVRVPPPARHLGLGDVGAAVQLAPERVADGGHARGVAGLRPSDLGH
jgi:hypothetical protein